MGALRQALLDLAAWVEEGIEPLPSTSYLLGADGQIHVEEDIKERYGIQPVIKVTANGSKCARVKVGEPVKFVVRVQLPKGAGEVTELVMAYEELQDAEPDGMFPVTLAFQNSWEDGMAEASAAAEYAYEKPGTYFATVRVKANRSGNREELFCQVQNLDRVRVIVE